MTEETSNLVLFPCQRGKGRKTWQVLVSLFGFSHSHRGISPVIMVPRQLETV